MSITPTEMLAIELHREGKPKTKAAGHRIYMDPATSVEFEAAKAHNAAIVAKVRAEMKLIKKKFKGK